jgi:methyl-accepting chemotaxis protein
MVHEENYPRASNDDEVLQRQYMRALSSFEGIVLSQIEVKNKLGDRLNYSIRSGIIILGVIAFSILVLLLTLSSQINRISHVVEKMNEHFSSISVKMDQVKANMETMETRVALIEGIDGYIDVMDDEMVEIKGNMSSISSAVTGIRGNLSTVRDQVGKITLNIDQMNLEMQALTQEMHRMAKPARSMNRMFPFP